MPGQEKTKQAIAREVKHVANSECTRIHCDPIHLLTGQL